uniref:Uncharacterized protein n=1 Tax=Poecilia formosa TaxID=48698 RepID=A0A096LZ21_POEFO
SMSVNYFMIWDFSKKITSILETLSYRKICSYLVMNTDSSFTHYIWETKSQTCGLTKGEICCYYES